MRKLSLFISIVFFSLLITNCEKSTKQNGPIKILTDKATYSLGETIKVEVINNSDSIANYYVCSSFKGIPPNILKFDNGSWKAFWSPICNGFTSFCCLGLMTGDTYKDTLDYALVKGTYRLEYQFIVRPSHEYKSYFSNAIEVK